MDDIIYDIPGFKFLYVTPYAHEEISSCFTCCCGDERLLSIIISTGITGLALAVNLLICRLQFKANNAQLITAIASCGPILEKPQRNDLLICLCKRVCNISPLV